LYRFFLKDSKLSGKSDIDWIDYYGDQVQLANEKESNKSKSVSLGFFIIFVKGSFSRTKERLSILCLGTNIWIKLGKFLDHCKSTTLKNTFHP